MQGKAFWPSRSYWWNTRVGACHEKRANSDWGTSDLQYRRCWVDRGLQQSAMYKTMWGMRSGSQGRVKLCREHQLEAMAKPVDTQRQSSSLSVHGWDTPISQKLSPKYKEPLTALKNRHWLKPTSMFTIWSTNRCTCWGALYIQYLYTTICHSVAGMLIIVLWVLKAKLPQDYYCI